MRRCASSLRALDPSLSAPSASRWLAIGLLAAAACTSSEQENPSGTSATEHAEHAAAPVAPGAVTPPSGAKVMFVEPSEGAEVRGPSAEGKVSVHVKMGVEGITVREAGQQIEGTGHHHIIVDGQGIPLGGVVPKDDTHLHYGKGQTEADVLLPPGDHSLTLQFADGAHLSYGPTLSSTIKIKVVEAPQTAAAPTAP
jgi:hypothetical protein